MNKWIINTPLLYHQNYARTLTLGGTHSGDNEFAGLISNGDNGGTLCLAKANTGKWILSGANTYSGPTTISAGILEIGGAGLLGGGTYATNIVNSATFRYNSTATQKISGVISGTGILINNNGTLNLMGTNTYSGATTVSNGTLLVNGSLNLTSRVMVANAGTLGGAGTVGIVTNSGTLAPGNGSAMGTLTTSNLVLNAGCTNAFDLGATNTDSITTNSDSVVVNGNLTLNGGVITVTAQAGFGVGTYTLFSYGTSSGGTLPTVAASFPFRQMSLMNDTTAKKVLLIVDVLPDGTVYKFR